jgi:hypothetical protein
MSKATKAQREDVERIAKIRLVGLAAAQRAFTDPGFTRDLMPEYVRNAFEDRTMDPSDYEPLFEEAVKEAFRELAILQNETAAE